MQNLLKAIAIGPHQRQLGGNRRHQFHPVGRRLGLVQRQHRRHRVDQTHRRGVQHQRLLPPLRRIQNIAHQLGQPSPTGDDRIQKIPLLDVDCAHGALNDGLRQPDHPVQGGAQFVGGVGQKFVFNPIQALQFLVGLV